MYKHCFKTTCAEQVKIKKIFRKKLLRLNLFEVLSNYVIVFFKGMVPSFFLQQLIMAFI